MTNMQSLAGGVVWMAVAAILMLITFEPVSIDEKPAAGFQATASAEAPAPEAAI